MTTRTIGTKEHISSRLFEVSARIDSDDVFAVNAVRTFMETLDSEKRVLAITGGSGLERGRLADTLASVFEGDTVYGAGNVVKVSYPILRIDCGDQEITTIPDQVARFSKLNGMGSMVVMYGLHHLNDHPTTLSAVKQLSGREGSPCFVTTSNDLVLPKSSVIQINHLQALANAEIAAAA